MKFVRTTRGHEAVTLPDVDDATKTLTFGRVPIILANEPAEKYAKAAAEAGVELTVTNAPDGAESSAAPVQRGQAPDLSEGVWAVTGTGDPVQQNPTPGDAGDTQED